MDLAFTGLVVTGEVASMARDGERLLDGRERARLTVLGRDEDRARFIAGAALLRRVVSTLTGLPPEDVPMDRTCPDCTTWHGRPVVPGSGLHVSISHAGDLVQVAVTRSAPVGVDIENRATEVTDAMRTLFAATAPHIRSAEEFLTTWARVEAVLKATGEGLRVPLDQVRVSGPDEAPRLVSYRGEALGCRLYDQCPRRAHVGSVAILTDEPVQLLELTAREFFDTSY